MFDPNNVMVKYIVYIINCLYEPSDLKVYCSLFIDTTGLFVPRTLFDPSYTKGTAGQVSCSIISILPALYCVNHHKNKELEENIISQKLY